MNDEKLVCLRCGAEVAEVIAEPSIDGGKLTTNEPCGCARINGVTVERRARSVRS